MSRHRFPRGMWLDCALAVWALQAPTLQTPAEASPHLVVKKTVITLPQGFVPNSLLASGDLQHTAFLVRPQLGRVQVVRDGHAGAFYQQIPPTNYRMSQGGRLAYAAIKAENSAVVVTDDGESPSYHQVVSGSLHFSVDGRHLFYIARRGAGCFAVIDGKEQATYSDVSVFSPGFSPDGRRFAYIAQKDGLWRVVTERDEDPAYAIVGSVTFSPDSRRLVYIAHHDDLQTLINNGTPGMAYSSLDQLTFSPDGKRLACVIVDTAGKYRVTVDGVLGETLEAPLSSPLLFSPNGRRLAYLVSKGDDLELHLDGTVGKAYRGISDLTFSPDSRHLAYVALRKSATKVQSLMVRDGQEGRPFDFLELQADRAVPIFSPDSTRLAYSSQHSGMRYAVVNEKTGKAYQSIRWLNFSPDGKHVLYFGTDSKSARWLVIDGRATRLMDRPSRDSECIFTGARSLLYLAPNGRRLARVRVTLPL